MSLDTAKAAYKTALMNLYTATLTTGNNADTGLSAFLDAMIAAQEAWIQAATIHYTGGLTAGSQVVTGAFNGNLQ